MAAILDYRCVLALHDERNFARAARALGVSQPALSARLRRLETDLGARLFDRGRHGAIPTPAGDAFAEVARQIVNLADEAALAAQSARQGMGQSLRIGFTQIAGRRLVRPVLAAFRREHPLARVRLREGTSAALELAVEESRADVALLHPPIQQPGLSEAFLRSEPLILQDHGPTPDLSRPVIRYPRQEAPVLLSEYTRKYPDAARYPAGGEADTIRGAALLSEAGYGPYVGPASDPRAASSEVIDMELGTSIVWRSLDRRAITTAFVEIARRIEG